MGMQGRGERQCREGQSGRTWAANVGVSQEGKIERK